MLAVRHGATLAVATALISLAALVRPAAAQVEGGTHIPIRLETPRDYKGAGDTPETRWSYELHDPDATYIAIHFRDFDLGPGDYLLVSDGAGRQAYTLQGRGKMNAGTFWAQHIKGDTVLLDLVVVGYEGGHGFEIDEYVAGFIDLGPPPTSRAICGTDDKQNAKCYQLSHPAEYNRGRAVCRLLSNGSAFCTGWLASAENHVITNEHCITSASAALNTDFDFMAEAPTCGTPNCADCFPGVVYSGATFIQDSYNYDYCLVQIASGNPAASFGYLELDNRVAVPGEEIYIPQHPGGRAKEFAIFSTAPQDAGGIARVYSITQPACQGSGYSDVGYYADTEGGSSGSPVIARSSHKVIALHHCANCPNRGVPITLVYGEIGAYLTPGPAGTLELDKGRYGCADLVAVELRDGDLLGTGTHAVTVAASGGDAETITLTETGASTGVFIGTIATSAGPANSGDGTLQVADGQTVTATYIDADDGAGNYNVPVTDSAFVDCVGPQILNVQTTSIEPRAATITITANEAVRGTVRYGLSCSALNWTVTGSGFASAAVVNVTGLTDNTTYYYKVEAADEAGNVTQDPTCYSFTTPEVPDFFTQLFSGDNDLDYQSLVFTPNGSTDFYHACNETITALPTDPAGGTTITLTDDSSTQLNLTGGASVSLYGVSYTSFFVGSNGYVTFNSGDSTYTESLAAHFNRPRISGLFDDLDPAQGGTLSWKQLADRAVVTWLNTPEHNGSNQNTFQIEMYFDGQIKINYLAVAATDGLAGLSRGTGVDPDFLMSDLTALGTCQTFPPTAHDSSVSLPVNTPTPINLIAEDDGLPNPPGALTFSIVALPAHGSLADPNGGAITAVPYVLLNGGHAVVYTPATWYVGADSFQFLANDGGTPPDGGDSNIATLLLNVYGVPEVLYSFPLNTNPGWTTTGAWAFGQPTGAGTHNKDPNSGYTGTNVYGYNLAGDYTNNMPVRYLTTTALDCSAAAGVELRFWRWLGVEQFDHAGIDVSTNGSTWTPVWANNALISESAWSFQTYTVPAADHQATVYFRWSIGPTDVSITYPGWNIDDIEIWGVVPHGGLVGDMNCDGQVGFGDINPFVLALTNPGAYAAQFPTCNIMHGDINGDGSVGFGDINPFVNLLTTP